MSRRMKWLSLVSSGLLCLFVLGLLAGNIIITQAAWNEQDAATVTLMQSKKTSASYWTTTRMRSALPAEELLKRLPGWQDEQKKRDRVRPSATRVLAKAIPTGSYDTFPYSTIGKVFFTDKLTGEDYVCSGTAVESTNGNTVDTAGHCVMEGGSGNNYYTNWIFCPQYLNGDCAAGRWSARFTVASRTWARSGDLSQDLAAVVVHPLDGQDLIDVVGGVRFGANLARSQSELALGYPAGSPFDGERLQSCSGTTRDYTDGNPRPIGIRCDMTGGSSGGGWLVRINGTWYLNGHNDFGSSEFPDVMWSPYFGSEALTVFNRAQRA